MSDERGGFGRGRGRGRGRGDRGRGRGRGRGGGGRDENVWVSRVLITTIMIYDYILQSTLANPPQLMYLLLPS